MPDTLITIGITCYREGDLLRECWESVLAQTDDRWVEAAATCLHPRDEATDTVGCGTARALHSRKSGSESH